MFGRASCPSHTNSVQEEFHESNSGERRDAHGRDARYPTPPASAQNARPLQFGLSAGASLPTGAFGNRVDPGTAFGADVAYRLGRSPFGLRADVQYAASGLTSQFLDRFNGINDGNASILSGTLDLTLSLPRAGKVQPYLLGGGGVYRRRVSVDRVVGEEIIPQFDPYFGFFDTIVADEVPLSSRTQAKFGLNGGGGIMIPIAGVSTFIEARYNDAFTSNRHTIFVPIMFGIHF